jgi:riboflavin-specific deaminase-like protein
VSEAIGTQSGLVLRRAAQSLVSRRDGEFPAVTLSWAQSATGAIARADGAPIALSGPESLVVTHRLRALHDAILVGIGTVIADDPLLSVRLAEGPQPQPVILDSRLRFPSGARLLARKDRKPWIFHADDVVKSAESRVLQERGARLFAVPGTVAGLDLRAVLQTLAAQGVASLMVEGGARVLRSFLSEGLAGQAVVTVSPCAVDGLPGPGMPTFRDSIQELYGQDTVIWGEI